MQDHLSCLLQTHEKQNTQTVYKTHFETKKTRCQSSEADVWVKIIIKTKTLWCANTHGKAKWV